VILQTDQAIMQLFWLQLMSVHDTSPSDG